MADNDPFGADLQNALAASSQASQAPATALAPTPPGAPADDPFGTDLQNALSGKLAPPQAAGRGALSTAIGPAPKPLGPPSFYDTLSAIAQGYNGSEGLKLAPDEAQWRYREMQEKGLNPNEVALRNPDTSQYSVYLRDPKVERNKVPVWSELQGLGEAAGPYMMPGEAPAVAGAQALTKKQQLYQDYESLGIPANPPAISPRGAPALASQGLLRAPFAGGPIRRAIEGTTEGTSQAAENLAGEYGLARIPQEAGETVQKGIQNFARGEAPAGMSQSDIIGAPSWATSVKAKADALYDRANGLIDQQAQIPLPNTLQALRGPMSRFPTNPAVGRRITDPTLRGFADDIENGGGTLTVPETRALRTHIGSMTTDPGLRGNTPLADLDKAYGALTTDLRTNAMNQSPQALQAFDRATQFYNLSGQRLRQLEPLVSGSPEQTFGKVNAAAGIGKSANAGLLQSLSRSMPPDEWNDVGATVIRQMGTPPPGSGGGAFSPASFSKNWKSLSDAAKDTLFGTNEPDSNRESLEALSRVTGEQAALSKLQNVSHSAEHGGMWVGGIEAASHWYNSGFSPKVAAGYIGAAVGANAMSRMLMSPTFARWLYGMPSVMQGNVPGSGLQRLSQGLTMMARGNKDIGAAAPAIRSVLGLPQEGVNQGPN